jgi:hypothetical protein
MERNGEQTEKEESSRSGTGSDGRIGLQGSQEASEQRKWTQRWVGQKLQENPSCETQCAPAKALTPQRLNLLVEDICTRFGDYAMGRGNRGIGVFRTRDAPGVRKGRGDWVSLPSFAHGQSSRA